MASDIVQEFRNDAEVYDDDGLKELLAVLDAARAEAARYREALEPLAAMLDDPDATQTERVIARHARAALAHQEESDG